MQVKYDGVFNLASGKWRMETSWKNRVWRWSELLDRLSKTVRTAETYKEYLKMPLVKQSEVKDIGGFVGGFIVGGNRKNGSVLNRQLITLDIDFANESLWEDFCLTNNFAAAVYSTHKHTPDKPRLRLVIPLSEEIGVEKYEPIARKIAGKIGIGYFDKTTFQPERLMYWPSTSADAEYVFDHMDAPWLNPDTVLAEYKDWRNIPDWPGIDDGRTSKTLLKEKADPRTLKGVQGAFNRTYTVSAAIDKFLTEEYAVTANADRYSYLKGSQFAGLVLYDDLFCYSHHASDPAGGGVDSSWSAWDLVRIHKFGPMDANAKDKTPIHQLPSNKAMKTFARSLDDVRGLMAVEDFTDNLQDYDGNIEEDPDKPESRDWHKKLEKGEDGRNLSSAFNLLTVLKNDHMLGKRLAKDLFDQRLVVLKNLPWRSIKVAGEEYVNDDDSCLRNYLSVMYNMKGRELIADAMTEVVLGNTIHSVRDWLDRLEWGGRKRIDTLLVDYLGATDSEYTRAVTRKALVAAAARVYEPGVKFDTMLVIMGAQGTGKSTILKKLGGKWFSDSFSFKHLKDPDKASLQLQGVWLVEIAELSGMRKAEVEDVKQFLSRTQDRYKVIYKPRTEAFPRQCVFFGTTNNRDFLKDPTGNRRFWPIDTLGGIPTMDVFKDLTEHEVEQIWAEAVELYKAEEPLFLPPELISAATAAQSEFTDNDERVAYISAYLDAPITPDWDKKTVYDRREMLNADTPHIDANIRRDKVCLQEIWAERMSGDLKDLTQFVSRDLRNLMLSVPGWIRAKGNMRFGIYGQQKGYVREHLWPEGVGLQKSQF